VLLNGLENEVLGLVKLPRQMVFLFPRLFYFFLSWSLFSFGVKSTRLEIRWSLLFYRLEMFSLTIYQALVISLEAK
jgi:hypothetical protein